jgi:hypothetical protein
MTKTYSNALFVGALAVSAAILLGCGGGGGGETSCTSSVPGEALNCTGPTDTTTDTETSTGSITGTTTVPGTGGAVGTGGTTVVSGSGGSTTTSTTSTSTSTGTSTWVPNADCNIIASSVAAAGGKNIGLWPLAGWNICITLFGDELENLNIQAKGYAYKASEFVSGQTWPQPASIVRVSGVLGRKCVQVKPELTTTGAPTLQGNGAITDSQGVTTISDGVTTVTWQGRGIYCPYDYDMVPGATY